MINDDVLKESGRKIIYILLWKYICSTKQPSTDIREVNKNICEETSMVL